MSTPTRNETPGDDSHGSELDEQEIEGPLELALLMLGGVENQEAEQRDAEATAAAARAPTSTSGTFGRSNATGMSRSLGLTGTFGMPSNFRFPSTIGSSATATVEDQVTNEAPRALPPRPLPPPPPFMQRWFDLVEPPSLPAMSFFESLEDLTLSTQQSQIHLQQLPLNIPIPRTPPPEQTSRPERTSGTTSDLPDQQSSSELPGSSFGTKLSFKKVWVEITDQNTGQADSKPQPKPKPKFILPYEDITDYSDSSDEGVRSHERIGKVDPPPSILDCILSDCG